MPRRIGGASSLPARACRRPPDRIGGRLGGGPIRTIRTLHARCSKATISMPGHARSAVVGRPTQLVVLDPPGTSCDDAPAFIHSRRMPRGTFRHEDHASSTPQCAGSTPLLARHYLVGCHGPLCHAGHRPRSHPERDAHTNADPDTDSDANTRRRAHADAGGRSAQRDRHPHIALPATDGASDESQAPFGENWRLIVLAVVVAIALTLRRTTAPARQSTKRTNR